MWEDLPRQLDYLEIVNLASTEDNENLRRYFQKNVFIVKEGPGDYHWLTEVPGTVMAIFRST